MNEEIMRYFLYFGTPQEKLLLGYYGDTSDVEYFCKRHDKYRNYMKKLNKKKEKENERGRIMKKRGLFWDEDASRLEEETGLHWSVAYIEVSRDCSKIKKHLYCHNTKESKELILDNKWHRCKLAFPKKCPKCGHELVFVERYGKENKKDDFNWNKSGTWRFLGCSNYPNCNYIEKEEKMQRPRVKSNAGWGDGTEFHETGDMWMDASEFF